MRSAEIDRLSPGRSEVYRERLLLPYRIRIHNIEDRKTATHAPASAVRKYPAAGKIGLQIGAYRRLFQETLRASRQRTGGSAGTAEPGRAVAETDHRRQIYVVKRRFLAPFLRPVRPSARRSRDLPAIPQIAPDVALGALTTNDEMPVNQNYRRRLELKPAASPD